MTHGTLDADAVAVVDKRNLAGEVGACKDGRGGL